MSRSIFGVDYQFKSCGSVFTDGLVHAAAELGITYRHADWSTPSLPEQVEACQPDLLFVVHGRKFIQRWRHRFDAYPSAVWLTDEPYEVDDTSTWSDRFGTVFVNDPATLHRHERVTYLPVCYDPAVHRTSDEPRPYGVGFIGGGNATRERYLGALADLGLLAYVIGGPWAHPLVQKVCRALTVPPRETVAWYQRTRIVLNVFRAQHHFNREGLLATSLNPRVYEALACGALVVSEWRPEIETLVPELPTFHSVENCLDVVMGLLADPDRAEQIRRVCWARLAPHTYTARLSQVLTTCGLEAMHV